MKVKKILCILFAAALLLAGCSSPAPQQSTEATEATQPDPSDPAAQITLLMNAVNTWRVSNDLDAEPYYYAVTDLDRNGRLEILAASTQGTGFYTYGKLYEVGADFVSIQECTTPCMEEYGDLPEVIINSVPAAYNEADGTYDYLFTNDTRNGAAEYYQSVVVVRLQDGVLSCTTLANSYDHYIDEGIEEHEYAILSGDVFLPATESEYNAVASSYQAERTGFTAQFEWFNFETEVNESVLRSSWNVFHASQQIG